MCMSQLYYNLFLGNIKLFDFFFYTFLIFIKSKNFHDLSFMYYLGQECRKCTTFVV